jgi:hypothetical protein
MIATVLIWSCIFIISTSFGHLLFRALNRLIKTETDYFPSFSEVSIFGLIGIGVLLSYFSIFSKIGLISNIIILAIVLFYFIFDSRTILLYYKNHIQQFKKYPLTTWFLIALYLIMILFAAQTYPKVYDTGLYHAQNIQWISTFRTIPGLGNLHGRFAFNNQSFLLESFFSLSFLKLGTYHLVNSYLLLIFSLSLIVSLQRSIQSDWIKSVLYFGLLILFQIFHLVFTSSPTPDLFSTVGIWFVFITFFIRLSSNSNNKTYWIFLILCSFFLVTVKLSALPLILIALIYLINPRKGLLKRLLTVTCLGLIVFVPFLVRNYLISGYLIYPYPAIDIFNPDWKIPLSYVQEMKSVIASFAQSRDWQVRPFDQWVPIWFSNLSTIFKLLSVFVLISPVLILLIVLLRKSIRSLFKSELKILIICFTAMVFWFFSAPNWRFVYGFLFIYLLIIAMIILHLLVYETGLFNSSGERLKNLTKTFYPGIIYTTLIVLPLIFLLSCDFSEIRKSTLSPVDYRSVPIKTIAVNNLKVNVPLNNDQCWNTCIPCSFLKNNIGITDIEMRGKDLKDGFRVKKQSEKY